MELKSACSMPKYHRMKSSTRNMRHINIQLLGMQLPQNALEAHYFQLF